jgi:hypothetical protein
MVFDGSDGRSAVNGEDVAFESVASPFASPDPLPASPQSAHMSTQETGPANSTPVKSHVPDRTYLLLSPRRVPPTHAVVPGHTPSQLASSSSPSLSASTMASSVIKGPKEPLDEAMEVDSDDDVEIVGDAEVAVLESRNGSPVVGKGSKRKSAGESGCLRVSGETGDVG